jgi:hypothetical protein
MHVAMYNGHLKTCQFAPQNLAMCNVHLKTCLCACELVMCQFGNLTIHTSQLGKMCTCKVCKPCNMNLNNKMGRKVNKR